MCCGRLGNREVVLTLYFLNPCRRIIMKILSSYTIGAGSGDCVLDGDPTDV
jgi:hypothetical protein